MQGIVYVPDCHLQTGSPPPNSISVPQTNMDLSPELDVHAKEIIVNQSNQSDSGILSATGNSSFLEMDRSNCCDKDDTENRSDCSSPDRKYLCPICETMLTSQHEFTIHIRSHNNESEVQDPEKGFSCRICSKVLSSSASLDRHMLIHSGERPFMCKHCGDTFTTNGNMHRHMRTHTNRGENYESDGSTDSGASSGSKTEYNNNKISSKTDSNKSTVLEVKTGLENKRKLLNYEEEQTYKQSRRKLEDSPDNALSQNYICPVCDRDDFNSIDTLEMHLFDNHPDHPAKCNHCNQIFKNNKLLNEHKSMVHYNEENGKPQRNSVVGFKDLTFVDFSSQKFPYIAKYECEKNLHKVAGGLKFQCERCSRAFPCANSLEIHHSDCISGLDLSIKHKSTNKNVNNAEKDIRRNDFFARLDLQNNSQEVVESSPTNIKKPCKLPLHPFQDNNKDLADIQSIISMTTNGTLLQQLQAKTADANSSLRSICSESEQEVKHENEEESQDLFAAEFRKMKLRGEFPCRLCTAVFPNLRALKGHNRAHLNGNTNGNYRCNMCPHSSIDKAALIRHMRTHNGDRPYECSLCNYAFTTKANCERHLRNRHAKSTREEVKKSIIYHPSEDPSNEEISKILARQENSKGSISLTPTKLIPDVPAEKAKVMPGGENFLSTPDFPNLLPEKRVKDVTSPISISNSLLNMKSASPFKLSRSISGSRLDVSNVIQSDNLNSLPEHKLPKSEPVSPYLPPYAFAPKVTNTSTPQKIIPKIHVKNLESMQSTEQDSDNKDTLPETHSTECDEEPMDLVLDLSKKKTETKPENIPKPIVDDIPQDLSKKSPESGPSNRSDILARQLLKSTPKIDPASIYASQLAMYRNTFPALHGLPAWPFSLNPMLFQAMPSPMFPQDPQEIKERLQRLQLCGGGMVMDNFTERLKNYHQQSLSNTNMNAFNNFTINDINSELNAHDKNYSNHSSIKSEEIKPLSLNIDSNLNDNLMKMQSPIPITKSEPMGSPNSVKMVIKNGVLMPKQKQRRYRTERPFSCEYCSARFTLRSNMERHIKQQHPQYWSQRQRSNVGGGNRKIQSGNVTPRSNYCNINIPNYDTPKKQSYDETKEQISDKIKYALLAQHLKAAQNYKVGNTQDQKIKEEDEDFELVIDEKDEGLIKREDQEKTSIHCEKESSSASYAHTSKSQILEENLKQYDSTQYAETSNSKADTCLNTTLKNEDVQDLVPVARLLDNASQQPFKEYFRSGEEREGGISEEDEEGLVASSSTSDGNNSGTDENRSESENTTTKAPTKKKSAYSMAPNRVSCQYCQRKFPWISSLRRHILTHTGQKPFKCSHCPLLFTTKSNCDRHLLRKHGNSATTVNNELPNNNSNYMMRNVPERPFKCANCPSSTFSTYSNLKKHISCKHSLQGAQSDDAHSQVSTGYEASSSDDEKMPQGEQKSDWDKQITSHNKTIPPNSDVQNSHLQNSDLPFKCHLCDNSFGDRSDAIDHIKDRHGTEYNLLMSKNAFDANATTPDDNPNHDDNEDNEVRGKFPDYANRKVICAFCMRRFWSAEDLRRHMRTHTGERPFSCDICYRRFTLKHSMLRHRKKHNLKFESDNINSDEDVNNANMAPAFDTFVKGDNNNLVSKTDESDGTEGSDLISNLLGIRDRSIIDQVLTSSADDAAKLLGVKGGD